MEGKMKQNMVETTIGFLVLFIAAWFLIYALKTKNMNTDNEGYLVTASFQNADGIIKGSDIMVAGIKIGEVENMELDRQTFRAVMKLRISDDFKLPNDSEAGIVSSGFLGNKFVSITPGIEDDDLKDGDQIIRTHSSVNLESLIGKFMYNFGGSK